MNNINLFDSILDIKIVWLSFCLGILYIYLQCPYPKIILKKDNNY
jgi:hypothetical protein